MAVPITAPAWVRSSWVAVLKARAMPKSATFTLPLVATRMLAGLMSRWTMPLVWAKPSAPATSVATSLACIGDRRPWARRMSARLLPSTYSITMKYVVPWRPQS